MFGLLRLMVIGFAALTVVYLSLSYYSRARRREQLEKQWYADLRVGDREAFVREGLEAYDGSLRRKLILLVYVIPVLAVVFIIYMVNFR